MEESVTTNPNTNISFPEKKEKKPSPRSRTGVSGPMISPQKARGSGLCQKTQVKMAASLQCYSSKTAGPSAAAALGPSLGKLQTPMAFEHASV
uniref:Uncharacterized protein n=1 Tax=Knipowitschia caucasica TaxID=637954 RepID=A0AAV2IY69_KNICA